MIIQNNGIITNDNYYQDREYITASMVKQALQGSKLQYDYAMEQTAESEAMLVGSAFHALVLEPDVFKSTYAFEPNMDKRTKAGKEYIAEWKELNKNIPIHLPGKYEEMLFDMKESLVKHPLYAELFVFNEYSEVETIKLFDLSGYKCKSKIDYYNSIRNYIVDIKTCNSVSEEDIIESIEKYHYDVQAAFYTDGIKADKFYFVFVQKKKPYDVLFVEYYYDLNNARVKYFNGLSLIHRYNSTTDRIYANYNSFLKL